MTEIDLAEGDWRGDDLPTGNLRLQIYRVACDVEPDEDTWVDVRGWWFPDALAPSPDPVKIMARWGALPAVARKLLLLIEAVDRAVR